MSGISKKKNESTGNAESKVVGPEESKEDDQAKRRHENENGDTTQNDNKQDDRSPSTRQRMTLATSKSLFVTGFAHAINKTHVQRLFSKFGTTERISDFMTSQKSTSNSRYCFIEYDSIESAQKAMDNLNGRTLLHKRLVVLPAHANSDDTSARKTAAVSMNPKKERVLLDQKIAALKKKIKESQGD
eukprot:CAMPEP_0116122210 /NCGR_PEP_ID=MMETSP0329-20121206/4095_1 /TAXON_ID=697910 /ORGANISM="Pseudo-nitzschia arenysensis, Strain B593" /LENGTH=186 /DNA_ID=CAMNT_0003616047 /DNA_START=53 /DNA_END=613 /DNA_ORIENTATION=+